jgi:hypothetical protein
MVYSATVTRPKLQTAVLKWFTAEEYTFEQETAQQGCAAAFAQAPNGGLLDIGVIMGRIIVSGGAIANASAGGGNVGNGTIGTESVVAGAAQVGTYTVTFTDATHFNVTDPKGNLVGAGVSGSAFSNQITFTLTAGGTPNAAGDTYTMVVAAGVATANAGNTGNATVGAITPKTGIQVGTYQVIFTAATKFDVFDPSGNYIGAGTTGTAFANQLGFTITAGGTPMVDGDGFAIVVAAGSGKVLPLSLTALDGAQSPVGVVMRQTVVSTTADAPVVLAERQAVLLDDGLIFPSGASTTQKAAIRAQLNALGLIVRFS